MQFTYRFQESGGAVREGEVSASSLEEAYSILRKSGVRPMKVWPKPGLFNRASAIGKRGIAIVLLAVLALAAITYSVGARRETNEIRRALRTVASPISRRQVADVGYRFAYESENLLVLFARPGAALPKDVPVSFPEDLTAALENQIEIDASDDENVAMLKRIVSGMKNEVAISLNGGESGETIIGQLIERQKIECAYRERIIKDTPPNEVNRTLRLMSFATDPSFPDVAEGGKQLGTIF